MRLSSVLHRRSASPGSPSTSGGDPAERFGSGLARHGLADTYDTSTLTRGLYSTDGSIYRLVPTGVVRPRTVEELEQVLTAARSAGITVTARGAGTSCAGNAVGEGIVVDTLKHLTGVLEVDPQGRTALVEPGVVQDALQKRAAPHGLRFGPDPSTSTRCTIGGMIGNNACGPRALGYGRTADNIVSLQVVTGSGEKLVLGPADDPESTPIADSPALSALKKLVDANLATIRTEFGTFSRQVSGYSLEHLLPENGFDVASFFAGTEGTLGFVTRARVRLVGDAPHKVTVALGYPSMPEAADATPLLLEHHPVAIEGLDRRIVDVVADRKGADAVPPLPGGDGWVFIEMVGDDVAEVRARSQGLVEAARAANPAVEGGIVDDPGEAARLWRIRADGAGLAGVAFDAPAYAGWEDSAVPPARLGAYLRDLDDLLQRHGLRGLPYGHFGDGCVHCRIDWPLTETGGARAYKDFIEEAADLVATYGGSMSGEHGDGRARSALLPKMYSAAAIDLFAEVKRIFDPENLLNPGVLVDPAPVDADIRAVEAGPRAFRRANLHFSDQVHQCSGVGKCIADSTAGGGVMCPSYQATREEKDSTRGRARALQEMVNGDLFTDGWRSVEVLEALDLCLSCKGCRSDCPTGVDMAAYKAEFLDHYYDHRLRPRDHYFIGLLPMWGRLVTSVPGLSAIANAALGIRPLAAVAKWAAGADQRRNIPVFSGTRSARLGRALLHRELVERPRRTEHGEVVIWVDSFTDVFADGALPSVIKVLLEAGYQPRMLGRDACCGLSWISTGQLDGARKRMRQSMDAIHPILAAGTPVIGIEPSCTSVWRSDVKDLLPDDPRTPDMAGVLTLAELLARTPGYQVPDLTGTTIVAQPHCHQKAVIGYSADAELLRRTGAEVRTLGGCCGLAGNFGSVTGHYEVSVQVAEHDLLPAIDAAGPDAVILADGFSCRTQVADLAERRALTLAELLARGVPTGASA
ncbi:FAD/FMN-containing dehydrogenase [Raineyella antarctica]|uniref:FAD/FMN-containing dehydrogenase n=1 Tax=Raineyella antarctica TaxID=1577474 RepID=A0A1G6H2F1_9ACTN|nr:FAD-binding and (Fe-S)-binding domain-containing protein [Raineyella antarctica]SDB88467.1 FAD/FMN-containing dehydrogenase [Raineyella antarctica]